jgi:hypothetical protein
VSSFVESHRGVNLLFLNFISNMFCIKRRHQNPYSLHMFVVAPRLIEVLVSYNMTSGLDNSTRKDFNLLQSFDLGQSDT